jgi:hypothetical protein
MTKTKAREGQDLIKSPATTYAVTSKDTMKVSNKKPSSHFLSLVDEWADSYIKSVELPAKIIEEAKKEDLEDKVVREAIESALKKRGLSTRRIRQLIPDELKDQSKISTRFKELRDAAQSAAAEDYDESEDSKELNKQMEEVESLEVSQVIEPGPEPDYEALYKQEQEQMQKLQSIPVSNIDEKAGFEWLAKQDDGISKIFWEHFGIKQWEGELSRLKNRGVRSFKRLYYEV